MSETRASAIKSAIKSGDKKTLCIRIKEFEFSLPTDYSNIPVEELGRYENAHKGICAKLVENNVWSPDKEVVINEHLENLKSFVQANRSYRQDAAAVLLAQEIEKKYEPIRKGINEEKKQWNWWS